MGTWIKTIRCFFGVHDYEMLDKYERKLEYFSGAEHAEIIYVQKCKTCGKLNRFKVD